MVCQGNTRHEILYGKTIPLKDDDYHADTIYLMVQCCGCEDVSFREEFHDYEVTYPDDTDNWVHEISIKLFPHTLLNHKPISATHILPDKIRIVYNETLDAIKSQCFLLSGAGFRAIIEAICLDKQITGKNLEIKIGKLALNRLITDKEAERLHAVRFIGNDSVHEMAVPKKETVYIVLGIIEHLLSNLYIIDQQAKSHLDTYITVFGDFETLLHKKLKSFKSGDDYPLAKFLERDIRRLNGQLSIFEGDLISKIQAGEFSKLSIGDIKAFGNSTSQLQHFIKV
jgi:hypothetical protein